MDTHSESNEGKTRSKKSPNLAEIRGRLLCKRMAQRFTNYEGVMDDAKLTTKQKIIHLQRAIDDATRRKIYFASLQRKLLQSCFNQ